MNPGSRKPRVTIDISPLIESQWSGIPIFTRRLALALLQSPEIELEFAVHLTRIPRQSAIAALNTSNGVLLREFVDQHNGVSWESVDPTSFLLYPTVKVSPGVGIHEASTIHDMSTLFIPECHEEANIAFHLDGLAEEISTNEVTFCISQATRAAFLKAFPSASSRARIIYQYADWPAEFPLMSRNLPKPAFGRHAVVVGTIEPRKNLGLLLRALDMPELLRSDMRFVVVGRQGWKVDKFLNSLSPEARRRIIFAGFVSEFTKYRLIESSEFLVYPSIYEGFGIPALEAMSLGKPILSSITGSLPEVVGDAGVYFDPVSVTEFAAAFDEISSPRRLAELAPIALKTSAAFTPQRMAQPVIDWAKGR